MRAEVRGVHPAEVAALSLDGVVFALCLGKSSWGCCSQMKTCLLGDLVKHSLFMIGAIIGSFCYFFYFCSSHSFPEDGFLSVFCPSEF